MSPKMPQPDENNLYLCDHVELITSSYRRLLDVGLIDSHPEPNVIAKNLFHAPFAVVSHDTSSDPIFNYANLKALELFEFNWLELTSLPSRLSAEPAYQSERDKLLSKVARLGYSSDYEGIRISKTGRRFFIKNATVWNLHDHNGNYVGQAACFANWQFLDEN